MYLKTIYLNGLLLAAFFLGLCVSALAEETQDVPSISNSTFEVANASTGLPYAWSGIKSHFARDTEVVRSGAASFRWTNSNPNDYRLSSATAQNLKPGDSYILSGWIKTEKVEGGTATICIEWSDANGQWSGGSYLRGIKGTNDWTRVHGIVRFPKDAKKPRVVCYGTQGAVGKAWFDDLEIVQYIPPCITALTTDKYRNQTIGGVVNFYAGVFFSKDEFSDEHQKQAILEVCDAAGEKVLKTVNVCEWEEKDVKFSFSSDDLAVGKYVLRLCVPNPRNGQIEKESITLTKLEKFPERKSYIDEHQRLIVDGKPFFPLGLYFHVPTSSDIQRLADSPFNCIMPYPSLKRELVDELYANGISCIYSVKDNYEGLRCKTDAEGRKLTTDKILELKDHPGIIAWYINDELPLSMKKVLTEHRDLVEELDPGRPAWVVLYQINDIRDYLPTFDVIGTDPYPLPKKPAGMAYDWAKRTREAGFGCRACWQVPQIFNWHNYRKESPDHSPTYEEMRGMIWMNIAGGANGIICYSYYDLYRNYSDGQQDEAIRQASFDRSWKDVRRIAEEVKKHEAVLLSIDEPAKIETAAESDAEIATRLYGYAGDSWLLAVNTVTESKTAVFTIPEGARVKNCADWTNVQVSQDGNVLKVKFDGLAPAFLQIGR